MSQIHSSIKKGDKYMVTTIAILSGLVGLLAGALITLIVVQWLTDDIEQEFPTPQQAPYKVEPKPRTRKVEDVPDENAFYQ